MVFVVMAAHTVAEVDLTKNMNDLEVYNGQHHTLTL